MRRNSCKRALTGLLCTLLLCAALPLSVSAAEDRLVPWNGKTIDVSWYNTTDTEFTISTPEQFMGLAAIVNGIYNADVVEILGDASCIVDHVAGDGDSGGQGNNLSTSTYHYGGDDFNGKTIYLASDLDMGGWCDPETGLWGGPRYMPIGGQYLMEPEDTSTKLSASFCGTLDGQGHYILNIYCPRHCTGSYGDGQSIGLIGRLGTHDNDPEELRPAAPAVRDLAVTGYIEGNRSVGGIVGKNGRSTEGTLIENCANYATVKNTDAKGCGGIVGAGWNLGTVRNCFNAGTVQTSYSCPTGGISGSNEMILEHCYSVGTISAPRESYAMAIGTNNGGGVGVDNCFWLTGSAPGGGYYGKVKGTVTELSESEMKAIAPQLGEAFQTDTGVNGGYPILTWQAASGVHPLDPAPLPAPEEPPPPDAWYAGAAADVAADAWYAGAVDYVMQAGLFDLTGEETFSPEAPMTRLMLAEALYRLAGSPAADASSAPFTDSSAPSVAWAYENGVVNGTGEGTFSPDDSITREQIAAMLMRYAALSGPAEPAGDLSGFPDAGSISSWAGEAAAWAVGEGLINGDGGGNFAPLGTATRSQVAAMLQRLAGQ